MQSCDFSKNKANSESFEFMSILNLFIHHHPQLLTKFRTPSHASTPVQSRVGDKSSLCNYEFFVSNKSVLGYHNAIIMHPRSSPTTSEAIKYL